jgi:hypothetical protein
MILFKQNHTDSFLLFGDVPDTGAVMHLFGA